jgi:hypothetical protein
MNRIDEKYLIDSWSFIVLLQKTEFQCFKKSIYFFLGLEFGLEKMPEIT